MFRHPKYYKELKEFGKRGDRGNHPPLHQIRIRPLATMLRRKLIQGVRLVQASQRLKLQAASVKPQAASIKLQAASDKLPNSQALIKFQAASIRGLD